MDKKELLKKALMVYAVTDRRWLNGRDLADDIERALTGGASMIQLREKETETEELIGIARRIRKVTDRYNVPLIIDDDVEAAIRSGAAGVHIGQDDMDAAQVRKMIGDEAILGVTVHNAAEAVAAQEAGADYLGAGAVFATSTKDDAVDVSLEELKRICGAVRIPVVAIGGIDSKNVIELKGTGIAGAAVVSAVFAAEDIMEATVGLASVVHKTLGISGLRAAIFDYDGTIMDSMTMWRTVPSSYIRKRGFEPDPDFDRKVRSMSLKEVSDLFREKYNTTDTDEDIIDDIMEMVYDNYRYYLEPKPGAVEFVKQLKAEGMKMCIATMTPSEMIRAANERLGIDDCFEEVYSCSDWDLTKTVPDIYHIAAAGMGAVPEETLVFEDMYIAARTAKDAGYHVIGVADHISEEDRELIIENSDLFIDGFSQWPGTDALKKPVE